MHVVLSELNVCLTSWQIGFKRAPMIPIFFVLLIATLAAGAGFFRWVGLLAGL